MTEVTKFQGDRGGIWMYDPSRQLGPPGGFGRVYAATAEDGTAVAVKVVDLASGVAARLRRREVEIADRLQGVEAEHLISVLDTAELNGKLLLVMERAERSLADHLEDLGALAEDEAIEILRDIAAGLRELHQASVIHRDLKPANVLLHVGRWKLADFGIARDAEIGTQTVTFFGAGTWPYMAPETWRGQSPTFKTDLYSLGCVAFELLSGSPPFRGPEEPDFARQHLEEQPPDLGVEDASLKRLVLRLLLKDPAARHQDARAAEEALTRVGEAAAGGRLAAVALQHAEERSREDAERSATEAKETRRQELGRQAAEDLADVLQEATDLIRRQILEVEFSWNGTVPTIHGPDATLELHLDSGFRSPIEGDDIIGFGGVVGGNRRGATGELLANVAYEDDGGRWGWNLYRFRAQAALREYRLGPPDREHGLSSRDFREHRQYMRSNVMHVFVLRKVLLTADGVEDLYTEAMELPAPRG